MKLQNTKAFTVLNLLVCSCVALMLTVTVLQHLIQIITRYKELQAKFKLQNALLLAKHYLSQDIRNAGYGTHYQNIPKMETVNICTPIKHDCSDVIFPSIQKLIDQKIIKQDADILILTHVPENLSQLSQSMLNTYDSLEAKFNQPPHLEDMIQIQNLIHADRFKVSAYQANKILHTWPENTSRELSNVYLKGSVIYRSATIAYYLRKTTTPSLTENSFTLFRDDLQRNAVALVDNIRDFKVITRNHSGRQSVFISLYFTNHLNLEVVLALRNKKALF